MHSVINQLIQLQELTVARAQQEVSLTGSHLKQLDESIASFSSDLPDPVGGLFKKLQKKDLLAIVPLSSGICTACSMSLPASFVQAVRQAEKIHQCPNCARLLYYAEASPRRTGQRKARRSEPPKIGIERFSSPELMIAKLSASTRDEAIEELCSKMEEAGYVDDGAKLAEAALEREAIVSTAVDNGLAFPHVRGVEGGGLTLALGIHKKGLKFGGPGRKLTRVIFFIVIPTAASAFYLKLLSGLTKAYSKDTAVERLLKADTPEKLWKVLVSTTKSTIS